MSRPFISFLTDFGLDTAPATCRGVIWSICPEARINDLTHSSRQFAIRDGAVLLWSSLPYQPIGVHLVVVDPGVGTARRPVALGVGRGDLLVGPDNGVLLPAARRLGGITAAHVLDNAALFRHPVSDTFHGRDIFAPVAAHLAAGVPLADVGTAIEAADLVQLDLPKASIDDGTLVTSVLFVDRFGNSRVAGEASDLAALKGSLAPGDVFEVVIGDRSTRMPWQASFGAVGAGDLLLYDDADYAGLAIGRNLGSAAEELGLANDVGIRIRPV
jgi:S-adenosylmethionine hydrolase